MTNEEIIPKLAALMFYDSQPRKEGEKKVSFEKLDEERQQPFLSLAGTVLSQLDKLNLTIIPKDKIKNETEIEALLKSRLETTVSEFFKSIKGWKKDFIPQAELVARIYEAWTTF